LIRVSDELQLCDTDGGKVLESMNVQSDICVAFCEEASSYRRRTNGKRNSKRGEGSFETIQIRLQEPRLSSTVWKPPKFPVLFPGHGVVRHKFGGLHLPQMGAWDGGIKTSFHKGSP
jgi:hypothetical protein